VDTAVKELTLEPAKFKSKNLDVVAEYKKKNRKNAANFVVIGMSNVGSLLITVLTRPQVMLMLARVRLWVGYSWISTQLINGLSTSTGENLKE
jgi:hypothetical protein